MPTGIPPTINKWQNSAEKSQAHNLKVVGSNPTPATNYINKINESEHPQRLRFLRFFLVLNLIRVWLYQLSYQPVVRFILFFKQYNAYNKNKMRKACFDKLKQVLITFIK